MGNNPDPQMPEETKIIKIYCQTDRTFNGDITTNTPFDGSARWHCKGWCRKWKITVIEGGDVKGTYDVENQRRNVC